MNRRTFTQLVAAAFAPLGLMTSRAKAATEALPDYTLALHDRDPAHAAMIVVPPGVAGWKVEPYFGNMEWVGGTTYRPTFRGFTVTRSDEKGSCTWHHQIDFLNSDLASVTLETTDGVVVRFGSAEQLLALYNAVAAQGTHWPVCHLDDGFVRRTLSVRRP